MSKMNFLVYFLKYLQKSVYNAKYVKIHAKYTYMKATCELLILHAKHVITCKVETLTLAFMKKQTSKKRCT